MSIGLWLIIRVGVFFIALAFGWQIAELLKK
jgi:hypothetical protein